MKQENRFVAQLFHFLAPFVDMNSGLFICVDGGAAKHHAGRKGGALLDPNVPDLWFTLVGNQRATGIEAKIIENGSVSVRQGQLQAWRESGAGCYKPTFWVAANRELTEFFCWRQSLICSRLEKSTNRGANVTLSLAECTPCHQSDAIAKLALFILADASGGV